MITWNWKMLNIKNYLKKSYSICFLLALFISCYTPTCNSEFNISFELLNHSRKLGFNYCTNLEKASQKDTSALLRLIRFAYKTDDLTAAEHGIIFSKTAIKLGDDFMISFSKKQSIEIQILILKMFEAAEEFSNEKIDLSSTLPNTLQFLKSNIPVK